MLPAKHHSSSTHRALHPAPPPFFWESSTRPLYPRWVWLEAIGQRHFILDNSAADVMQLSRRASLNTPRPRRPTTEQHSGSSRRAAASRRLSSQSDTRANDKRTQQQRKPPAQEASTKHNGTAAVQSTPPLERTTKSQPNPLTDRVLQWLDLAGRRTSTVNSDGSDTVASKLPHRRITTAQAQTAPSRTASSLLRRTESMHQLLPPTGESSTITFVQPTVVAGPPQTSATVQRPPSHTAATTISEFLPLAYRCYRAFSAQRIAAHIPNVVLPSLTGGAAAAAATTTAVSTQAMPARRPHYPRRRRPANAPPHKYAPVPAHIEQQYQELIQRKLHESVPFNVAAARRQLHIFMPNLPDKPKPSPPPASSMGASTTTTTTANGGGGGGDRLLGAGVRGKAVTTDYAASTMADSVVSGLSTVLSNAIV